MTPGSRPSLLIVGSGIAGLYVALRSLERGLRPTLVTKSTLDESNTRYAQGGIAAAIGPEDSWSLHLRDTLRAGAGIVDREAARRLVQEGPQRIADLVRYGVPFDTVEGRIALGREAAHSQSRIVHAGGDQTGLRIEETLKARAIAAGVDVRERTVLRTLVVENDVLKGAIVSNPVGGSAEVVDVPAIVLATGGAGSLYRFSSNPSIATGEGVAIAFRAGALLSDMEFIQFHPTTFDREGAPHFLITEAIRGEGAVLRNEAGDRFMPRYHRDSELAPRDVVSRSILLELERTQTRRVYLDATAIPRDHLYARFPSICRFLEEYGLDPSRDRIPVSPAAHYMIGGVATDVEGRSSIAGLYACGEVAATGVHGANRLASNSLLEGLVFGEHVVRQLLHPAPGGPSRPGRFFRVPLPRGEGRERGRDIEEVRTILWESVGIVRTARRLRDAGRRLVDLASQTEPVERGLPGTIANAALTALLITRAALTRTESRGAHFRSDFPRPDSRWLLHLGLRQSQAPHSRRWREQS